MFLPPSELLDTVKEMALPKSSVTDRSAVNELSLLFVDGANSRAIITTTYMLWDAHSQSTCTLCQELGFPGATWAKPSEQPWPRFRLAVH